MVAGHPIPASRTCVIATTPRTGSWLLAEGLHSTGLAGEPQEYFGWEGFERWSEEFGLGIDASPLLFVQAAITYGTTENGIFSTKMHWSQLERFSSRIRDLPGWWPASDADLLKRLFPDVHFVYLWRRDTARQAISYWRAVQAGAWWDNGSPWPEREPVTEVDLQQIRWCEDLLMGQNQAWRELLEGSGLPTIEIVYENLALHRANAVEAVLDFLGVDHDGVELPVSRLRRQSDEQTEAWLAEYRETKDRLRPLPSRWKWVGTRIEEIDS